MNRNTPEQFWPWYLRSARNDGASASKSTRLSKVLISVGVVVAWFVYFWRFHPFAATIRQLSIDHPVFIGAIIVAFALMNFRSTLLDYLAYRVHVVQRIEVRQGIFGYGTGSKLATKYEQVFGKDFYYRAPDFCGAMSVLVILVAGFVMVFSLPYHP